MCQKCLHRVDGDGGVEWAPDYVGTGLKPQGGQTVAELQPNEDQIRRIHRRNAWMEAKTLCQPR